MVQHGLVFEWTSTIFFVSFYLLFSYSRIWREEKRGVVRYILLIFFFFNLWIILMLSTNRSLMDCGMYWGLILWNLVEINHVFWKRWDAGITERIRINVYIYIYIYACQWKCQVSRRIMCWFKLECEKKKVMWKKTKEKGVKHILIHN